MMLVIDAGNSRTKWGVFDAAGHLFRQGAEDNADLGRLAQDWAAFPGLQRAALSCVAGEQTARRLQEVCTVLGLPVVRITSQLQACGVRNGYAAPERLGSDRWAALVAAWRHAQGPCVVVTAGTALTVDALNAQGEFLGGLIVPGYAMMRRALADGTAAVAPRDGTLYDFPATTADAVHSGALMALAGAVQGLHARLAAHEGIVPVCLLSGGDAALLAPLLPLPLEVMPELVLQGIYLLGNTLQ